MNSTALSNTHAPANRSASPPGVWYGEAKGSMRTSALSCGKTLSVKTSVSPMPRETQTLLHSDATISAVSSVGSATASSKAQSPHSAAASGGEPNQAAAQTARAAVSAASYSASARVSVAA